MKMFISYSSNKFENQQVLNSPKQIVFNLITFDKSTVSSTSSPSLHLNCRIACVRAANRLSKTHSLAQV